MDSKVTPRAYIGMICGALVGVALPLLWSRSVPPGSMAWGAPIASLAYPGAFIGLFIGAMIGGGLKGIYRKN